MGDDRMQGLHTLFEIPEHYRIEHRVYEELRGITFMLIIILASVLLWAQLL